MSKGTHGVVIHDHPFTPRNPNEPWGRCGHPGCWGFEGTHAETTLIRDGSKDPPYRCPRCVELDTPVCTHAPEVVEEFLNQPKEDPPEPLPVPEISLSEMQEYAVKEEQDLTCWKCQQRPGRKLPQNGAVLCSECETILKP